MFYAITFIEGSFQSTACVLGFYSRRARAAYPAQCAQRVETITAKQATQYQKRDGLKAVLMLWDESEPAKFNQVA